MAGSLLALHTKLEAVLCIHRKTTTCVDMEAVVSVMHGADKPYFCLDESSVGAAAVRSAETGCSGGIGTGSASDDCINACSVEAATEELSEVANGMNESAVLWGNMKIEARYRGVATNTILVDSYVTMQTKTPQSPRI